MSKKNKFRTIQAAYDAIAGDEVKSADAYVEPETAAEALTLDTNMSEPHVTLGDLVRTIARDANKAAYHEAASVFHSVEVAMGALKIALDAAQKIAGDTDTGNRLRDFIAEL